MNFLPFILIFILSIASYSLSFLHKSQCLEYESILFLGNLSAQRKTRNYIQKDLYAKAKQQSSSSKQATTQQQQQQQQQTANHKITHPRKHKVLSEDQKINIAPLFYELNPKQSPIYKLSENLLKILYEHCSFYEPGMEKTLLNIFILQGKQLVKKGKKEITLTDLYQENTLLYKVLKGTTQYKIGEKGIPPLVDFFMVSLEKNRKPVYFSSAKIEILQALFGMKIAQKIWDEEWKKKQKNPHSKKATLTNEELAQLINQQKQKPISNWEEILSFSSYPKHLLKKRCVQGVDSHTQICIRTQTLLMNG